MDTPSPKNDPYQLDRFVKAQEGVYPRVLAELKNGRKQSHWMWFIFPQIDGLGRSPTTIFYAIKSLAEAQQYLQHPILGARLLECAGLVLAVAGKSAHEIFSSPDDMKLKSCMTLFACVTDADPVFQRVLDKYYHGNQDKNTLRILGI